MQVNFSTVTGSSENAIISSTNLNVGDIKKNMKETNKDHLVNSHKNLPHNLTKTTKSITESTTWKPQQFMPNKY